MTTLKVNIDNNKIERLIKDVFDAMGLDYSVKGESEEKPMTGQEQEVYEKLQTSLEQIKLRNHGVIPRRAIEKILATL